MSNTIFTHRFIARFVVEADTPLFVGSGNHSLLKDALVQTDINGLPMIPGTSLAGVLRHSFTGSDFANSIFGDSAAKGAGSRLKVSAAYMMLSDTKVSEGILEKVSETTLSKYTHLPSRQHVRINEKGTAEKNGLFDNEVVYKGTRFVFELELKGTVSDTENWQAIINQVLSPTFRIGSGTRNGYGSLKVLRYFEKAFDLTDEKSFKEYLAFEPSFNDNTLKLNTIPVESNTAENSNFTTFTLNLKPDLFFVFSEGFGDDEADNKPLTEDVAIYADNRISFEKQTVLPASSIKGAISHRVAFHYNKLKKQFSDEGNGTIGTQNEAVFELLGAEGGNNNREAKAGNIFINDLYYTEKQINNNKIFNHVAIDRFTGGAMDGALFSEKVSNLLEESIRFSVFVKNANYNEWVIKSIEETLTDICKGLLPLGGMTTKGHGMFTGSLSENGKEIFNYTQKS